MKTKSTMLKLFSSVVALSLVGAGCSEISFYQIDPPADLQDKINEYQEEKNQNQQPGVEDITITTPMVGAEDGSSSWWTEFSDYFTVPAGKLLTIEFVNYGTEAANWNNYNLCVSTAAERAADGYSEYFVLRADAYGWGNADFNLGMISHNYADFDRNEDGDYWDDFRRLMNGASVVMKVDHSKTGNVFVNIECTATDGSVLTQSYQQPVSATEPINAFLICDGSWLEIKSANLRESEVLEVADEDAVSIVASGYPATVELGSEDVWGEAVATVTFADGSVQTLGKDDVTLTVPDLTTVGEKTVVYSYSKTKQGAFGPSVAGYYTVRVINPVVGLEAGCDVYIVGGHKTFTLSPKSVKVTAVFSDGSKDVLESSQYSVSFAGDKVTYSTDTDVEKAYTVTYVSASGKEITVEGDVRVLASDQPAQTEAVGAADLTTGWWTAFSRDWNVPAYTSQSVSLTVKSDAVSNWHSPSVVLRSKSFSAPTGDNPDALGYNEYVVVRMDNFGWDGAAMAGSYAAAVAVHNWNFDMFLPHLDGSKVVITVANAGDGTASVRYHVEDSAGEIHYQYYDGLLIDSADCTFAVVPECAYLIFD